MDASIVFNYINSRLYMHRQRQDKKSDDDNGMKEMEMLLWMSDRSHNSNTYNDLFPYLEVDSLLGVYADEYNSINRSSSSSDQQMNAFDETNLKKKMLFVEKILMSNQSEYRFKLSHQAPVTSLSSNSDQQHQQQQYSVSSLSLNQHDSTIGGENGNKHGYDIHFPLVRIENIPLGGNINQSIQDLLCSRSVLLEFVFQTIFVSKSIDEFVETLKAMERDDQNDNETINIRIQIRAIRKKLSQDERKDATDKIQNVLSLHKINVTWVPSGTTQGDNLYSILLDYETIFSGTPKVISKQLRNIIFCKDLSEGKARRLNHEYNLKTRSYIGPTTTDCELSFIMANAAGIKSNGKSLVLDPFVGTGSILLACTVFNATCFGFDIDSRVLHGKWTTGENGKKNIWTNFDDKGLPRPEIVRLDFCPKTRAMKSFASSITPQDGWFDAIVCDPPYGVRAGARKSGPKNENKEVHKIKEEYLSTHIPQTKQYEAADVMRDLLDGAAEYLRIGGRLVYLLPIFVEEYDDDKLPTHPCLRIIQNVEEKLTMKMSRRVIVMEKIKHVYQNGNETNISSAGNEDGNINAANESDMYSNLKEKIRDNKRQKR